MTIRPYSYKDFRLLDCQSCLKNLQGYKLTSLLPNQSPTASETKLSTLNVPWQQSDWLETAEIWIHDRLARENLRAIAPIEIVKNWALAIILRVKTTGGTVYFKASNPLFAQESEYTRIVSKLYPHNSPQIIGTYLEKNWLLMRKIDGELLENIDDVAKWQAALSHWARCQINAVDDRTNLISWGWLDLGLEEITKQMRQLFSPTLRITWPRKENFAESKLFQLLPLMPKLNTICQQLSRLGIPNTLVHGDLSPRNIYMGDRGFVYFDWSDTCISHPFFDLIRFLYEIEQDLPHVPDARSPIRDAYLEPWTIYAPMEQLVTTFELVSENLVSVYETIRDRVLRENRHHYWQWPTEAAVPFYLQRLLIQVATYLYSGSKTRGVEVLE